MQVYRKERLKGPSALLWTRNACAMMREVDEVPNGGFLSSFFHAMDKVMQGYTWAGSPGAEQARFNGWIY